MMQYLPLIGIALLALYFVYKASRMFAEWRQGVADGTHSGGHIFFVAVWCAVFAVIWRSVPVIAWFFGVTALAAFLSLVTVTRTKVVYRDRDRPVPEKQPEKQPEPKPEPKPRIVAPVLKRGAKKAAGKAWQRTKRKGKGDQWPETWPQAKKYK